jgi:hypothetical protein
VFDNSTPFPAFTASDPILNDLTQRLALSVPVEPATAPNETPENPPLVKLNGPNDRPVVQGKMMPPLHRAQYKVLKILADKVGVGFSESELMEKSGVTDARKALDRLRERHPEWAAVIHFPGGCYGAGYKIDFPTPR